MGDCGILKSNGKIEQWGNFTDLTSSTVSFYLNFSNSNYSLICKPYSNNSRDSDFASVIYPKTATGFTCDTAPGYGSKYPFTWSTTGY